ncbi:hypothetical protein HVY77_05965 [Escherichia coli]|uniref:Uncharacterized protein n=2 Tax=Escherichia coli TaxID=562 RepID=A0A7H9SC41_ECOLX|nr:hypothetical protein [Escherichia coli]MED9379672.1 hypothetical protein [Escherichia marmotae]EEZ2543866.1 hypothetical protein [Escherichia coli]EFE5035059.1 hypothetical protein [Escherichia coli]EFH4854742.1 hypothetical protein [Escherichia coli]EFH6320980.1 hypothetical protein [Escherichia coli]
MNQKDNSAEPQNILDIEDDILALKITIHSLINAISKCNPEVRDELMKNLSFEANRMERECPESARCLETLDLYFNQIVNLYNDAKASK